MKSYRKIVGHFRASFYNLPPHIRIDTGRLSGWGERWLSGMGLRQCLRGSSYMPVDTETQPVIAAVSLGRACAVEYPGMVVIRDGEARYRADS